MRQRRKEWALPLLEATTEYVLKEQDLEKTDLNTIFNNDNPVCVEIGTGKGDFIIGMAKKFPHINFVGIEVQATVLGYAVKKCLDEKIENLRFILMDGSNVDNLIKDHSLTCLFLNFSDPWPKKRHAKRRLTYKTFLEKYEKLLVKDGKIVMKTDNTSLYEFSVESMSENNWEFIFKTENYIFDESIDVQSEYERKFRERGQNIYRIIAKKMEG